MIGLLENVWSNKRPEDFCDIDNSILDEERFPHEGAWDYSVKYILLALAQKAVHARIARKKIEKFHEQAVKRLRILAEKDPDLDAHEAVRGFEKTWPKLSQMLREPAFYYCVKRFCMNSAFLYTYFVELSGYASALEMAMGYSIDITGRYRRIPECDGAYEMAVLEPTFRSFLERIWFSQQMMLRKARELGWRPDMTEEEKKQCRRVKVLFLGGGMLPQLRMYELCPETVSEMFDITVYDKDPKMPEYLDMVFDKPIEEYGIKYHFEDFDKAFKDGRNYNDYDIVIAEGVMSYYKTPEQTAYMLNGAYLMLKNNGIFVHDLQILEPSMLRCVLALAWRDTGLNPDLKAEKAIERIKTAADIAGFDIASVQAEVDYYNKIPAIVNFCLRKLW